MDLDDTWPRRLDNERRLGNIPGDQARALLELWRCCTRGDDMPSEARVASLAGVSKRTVSRAKATGRALELLLWERQWAVVDGLRQERPCSYVVEVPAAPCVRRERQSGARTGSTSRASGPTRSVQQQLAALPPVTAELRALIAARQAKYGGLPIVQPICNLQSDTHCVSQQLSKALQ